MELKGPLVDSTPGRAEPLGNELVRVEAVLAQSPAWRALSQLNERELRGERLAAVDGGKLRAQLEAELLATVPEYAAYRTTMTALRPGRPDPLADPAGPSWALRIAVAAAAQSLNSTAAGFKVRVRFKALQPPHPAFLASPIPARPVPTRLEPPRVEGNRSGMANPIEVLPLVPVLASVEVARRISEQQARALESKPAALRLTARLRKVEADAPAPMAPAITPPPEPTAGVAIPRDPGRRMVDLERQTEALLAEAERLRAVVSERATGALVLSVNGAERGAGSHGRALHMPDAAGRRGALVIDMTPNEAAGPLPLAARPLVVDEANVTILRESRAPRSSPRERELVLASPPGSHGIFGLPRSVEEAEVVIAEPGQIAREQRLFLEGPTEPAARRFLRALTGERE